MFTLIGVDAPFDRRPFLNWFMIIACVVIFGFQVSAIRENPDYSYDAFLLDGFDPGGLFAHMWLHDGPIDFVFNMIFLWLFGNAVCAKIGNLLYLPVYVFFGLAAAVTFNIVSDGVAIGSSGAVNGIAGMFLVFFPVNDSYIKLITKYGWSWEYTIPSFLMVGIWLVLDLFIVAIGIGVVSYAAHLVGFGMGVFIAILLLKFKIIEMSRHERSLLAVLSFGKDDASQLQDTNSEEMYRRAEEAMRRSGQDRFYDDEIEVGSVPQESEDELVPEDNPN